MTNSTQKISQWGRMREQGMWRFVLVRGVLVFGLVFSVLSWLVEMFVFNQPFNVVKLVVRMVVGGLVFGVLIWQVNERKYRKRVEAKQ